MANKTLEKALESGKISQAEYDAKTTVQASTVSDVHALRIAQLEKDVETLTTRLAKLKKFENFVSDYKSASTPLLDKCGLRGKHGITPFGYQSKLELVTEKRIKEAGELSATEKKRLSFLSKAGQAFVSLCDAFDKWTENTTTKEGER
jgi:hypothetical protein